MTKFRVDRRLWAMASLIVAGTSVAQPDRTTASPIALGEVRLVRIFHDPNVLADRRHAGFGSLLYDQNGSLVLHDGTKTWLYTTGLIEAPPPGRRNWYGKWVSYVREFDVASLASGPATVALGLAGSDRWSIVHDVIQVDPRLFVAFYSANGTVKAAVSARPEGPFEPDPRFSIGVTDAWERQGGRIDSLESNGAHSLIEDTGRAVTLWLGYDSYHVDRTAGQLGWAKIRIDKGTGTVTFLKKHPANPLPLLPKGYIAARCGGNLASNVRLGDLYAFFYYSRPSREKIMLTAALSADPLFLHGDRVVELEPPLGQERVIEKFESYLLNGELHIMYENRLTSGEWGTGIRIYKIER